MTEAFNALFKAELIRNPVTGPRGGWKSVSDVEIAVAQYVDRFNNRRLHGEIGLNPARQVRSQPLGQQRGPAYSEAPVPFGAKSKEPSLHETRGDSWTVRAEMKRRRVRNGGRRDG